MSLRFQNVIGSPPIKEILTFKSHSGAQHTIFFSNPGTILVPSPRRGALHPVVCTNSETDKNKDALWPEFPGGTSVVVVRSDGGWER